MTMRLSETIDQAKQIRMSIPVKIKHKDKREMLEVII